MDTEAGEVVMDGEGLLAKAVTASVAFTPEEPDGTQVVELSMDSKGLGGHKRGVVPRRQAGRKPRGIPPTRTRP